MWLSALASAAGLGWCEVSLLSPLLSGGGGTYFPVKVLPLTTTVGIPLGLAVRCVASSNVQLGSAFIPEAWIYFLEIEYVIGCQMAGKMSAVWS